MIDKRFFLPSLIILLIIIFSISMAHPETKKMETLQKMAPTKNSPDAVSDISWPQVVQLDADTLQVGTIKINKKDRVATIKGVINMSDGLVEYLACTPNGKLHESVLALYAEPYNIQVALLLLGMVPGNKPIKFQGAPEKPCGDLLHITISWKENNKTIEYSPEHLILNLKDRKIMKKTHWVFTGSKIMNGRYMAQIEGSIVAIYHDPFAIIDHTSITGTDDVHFFANKNILPPVGTPVEFKIYSETDMSVKKRFRCTKAEQ